MFKNKKVFAEYYITQSFEQFHYAKTPNYYLNLCFGLGSEALKTISFRRLLVLTFEFAKLFRPSRTNMQAALTTKP